MWKYPIVLDKDGDTVMVTFPDFPEAHTFGDDANEAIARSGDALATVVDGYIRARRPLPAPSPIAGPSAALSPLMSAKADIYARMLAVNVTKSELARRMHVHLPQVDRLLDLQHGSKVEQIKSAANALGGDVEVRLIWPALPAAATALPRKSQTSYHRAVRTRKTGSHVRAGTRGRIVARAKPLAKTA